MLLKDKLVAVGVPGATWVDQFGFSLLANCFDLLQNGVGGIIPLGKRDTILPRARQLMAKNAIASGATHAIFVDSDQSFPSHAFRRLLDWDKELVYCNIATKTKGRSLPTARLDNGTRHGDLLLPLGEKGLRRVWRVGFGVVCIDLSIFAKIPKPWFETYWIEEDDIEGEDWYFIEKAQEYGIKAWVDQGLSENVYHWGSYPFGMDDVRATMEKGIDFDAAKRGAIQSEDQQGWQQNPAGVQGREGGRGKEGEKEEKVPAEKILRE